MDSSNELTGFLRSIFYHRVHPSEVSSGEKKNPFLTISRQAGAGGHTLTVAVLNEMAKRKNSLFKNWRMLDQEICQKIIQKDGINLTEETLLQSEYHSQIEDIFEGILFGHQPQEVTMKKTFYCIHALAETGKIILLGRGASYLTQNLPLGVHIRLYAPVDFRIEKMMKLLEISRSKAETIVIRQDEIRERFIKHFFKRDINDLLIYDAAWNTGEVPMDEIASSVVNLVEAKALLASKVLK